MSISSSLNDVNRVDPGHGFPPLDNAPGHRYSIDALLGDTRESESSEVTKQTDLTSQESFDVLRRAVVTLGATMRSSGKPQTVLHVLLLADRLSIGQIAGRIHRDPREIELAVDALVDAGVIFRDRSGPIDRFSIIGLSGA